MLLPVLLAALLFAAAIPFASASTVTYCNIIVDGNEMGTLDVPLGNSTSVTVELLLNVENLRSISEEGETVGSVGIAVGTMGSNYFAVTCYNDTVLLTAQGYIEDGYDESFSYPHTISLTGNENVTVTFNCAAATTQINVNGTEEYSGSLDAVWQTTLTDYMGGYGGVCTGTANFRLYTVVPDPTPQTWSNTPGIPSWVPLLLMIGVAVAMLGFLVKVALDGEIGIVGILSLVVTGVTVAYLLAVVLGAFN